MDETTRERSLAAYLAVFAAAIVVPLLVLAGILAWRFADAESRFLEAGGLQRTENIAAEFDRLLASRVAILRVLATSPAIDAGDHARFDEQARAFAGRGIDIRLRDLEGRLLVDTGLPYGQTLPVWPLLPSMSQAVAEKREVFSDLFVSRGTKVHAVAIFAPVIRNGEVTHLVSTTFAPDVFAQIMIRFGVTTPYFASLTDRTGTIIARSDRHAEMVGKPLPAYEAAVGTSGTWHGINASGIAVSAFYIRSQLSGWLVTLGVDQAALNRSLTHSLLWLSATALLLVALSTLLGTAIVRRLASASTAMTDAAQAMGRGQLAAVPKTDVAEVNRVGEAFARASVKLHMQSTALARANRELEERVAERTAALSASEERYRLLAENASDLIVLRGMDWRMSYASPSATRLLGHAPEELVEMHSIDLVHPDDRPRVEEINRAIGEGRELGFSTHRLLHKEGHWVWVQAAYSRIDGRTGPGVMIVLRDDTERQEQETRLRQSNEALRQFSAIVSHDLQAPLRHIGIFSDLLKAHVGAGDPEAIRHASGIAAGVERMQRLIRSLITYSQVAYASVKHEGVDLARVVADAVALLDADIQAAGATIRAANLPTLTGDGELLTRLFQNLIGNAVKYRGEAPLVVTIKARPAGRFWEIAVEDNGIGIEPAYAERIFEIFRRLHKDESRYPGLGLGLALCRRIAESHGGEIWLDKERSAGARFVITLPRGRARSTPEDRSDGGGKGPQNAGR